MRKIAALLGLVLVLSIPTVESHTPYIYKPLPAELFSHIDIDPIYTSKSSIAPTLEPTKAPEPEAKIVKRDWILDPEVSWYGPHFYGKRTACGQAYTTAIMGVAHRSLPCGTLVSFRWKGKEATVPVIDRGPYVDGRIWDLSGGLCVYLDHCFTGQIEYFIGE